MLSVVMLSVAMMNVIMLNVVMLNVAMLNVIMLNVAAPCKFNEIKNYAIRPVIKKTASLANSVAYLQNLRILDEILDEIFES
jgi:hypothetical protein